METNTNRTAPNRPRFFWGGLLLGCLTSAVLGLCLVGGLIWLIAQGSGIGGVSLGPQSSDPLVNGQNVFQMRCSHCHSAGTDPAAGPGLAGLFEPGGPELPNGVDYDGRLPNGEEINDANVAEWIRRGGQGEIGHMPGQNLGDRQMNDLIAYLKKLEK